MSTAEHTAAGHSSSSSSSSSSDSSGNQHSILENIDNIMISFPSPEIHSPEETPSQSGAGHPSGPLSPEPVLSDTGTVRRITSNEEEEEHEPKKFLKKVRGFFHSILTCCGRCGHDDE